MHKLSIFIFALAVTVSPVMADLTYTTSFTSDQVVASAQAAFSIIDSTHIQVVLSDTTVNPFEDSQNLSAISFKLANAGTAVTGTLSSITGSSISQTPENTDVTPFITPGGATLALTPWNSTDSGPGTPDASLTQAGHISSFALIGTPGFSAEEAKYSIVATPTAGNNNKYIPAYVAGCTASTGTQQNCGTSLEFGQNAADDPMIYGQATFVYTLSSALSSLTLTNAVSGTCTTGHTCIDDVVFGFGPDGPDHTDVSAGVFAGQTNSTPEPSHLGLLILASSLVVFIYRRKQRTA